MPSTLFIELYLSWLENEKLKKSKQRTRTRECLEIEMKVCKKRNLKRRSCKGGVST